jgi:hypothetical protein
VQAVGLREVIHDLRARRLHAAPYSDPGNRRARLFTACGSANETRVALRTAAAWGYIDEVDADRADRKLDLVVAKTYRWLHPRK